MFALLNFDAIWIAILGTIILNLIAILLPLILGGVYRRRKVSILGSSLSLLIMLPRIVRLAFTDKISFFLANMLFWFNPDSTTFTTIVISGSFSIAIIFWGKVKTKS
jgi:hypothetical protein